MAELLEYSTGNYIKLHDQFLVGRSLECSYILEDVAVSRKHCKFTCDNQKWFLTDLSTNGLFVNDYKVEQGEDVELKQNDTISFSSYLFGFKLQRDEDMSYGGAEIINLDDTPNDSAVIQLHNAVDTPPVLIPNQPSLLQSVLERPPEPAIPAAAAPAATASQSTNSAKFDDELTCSICTELFINAVTLNCQHSFCDLCILTWRKNNINCPICRKAIISQTSSITINNMVQLVIATKTADEKASRNEVVQTREKQCEAANKPRPQARVTRGRGRGRGRARGRRSNVARTSPMARAGDVISVSSSDSEEDEDFYFAGIAALVRTIFGRNP